MDNTTDRGSFRPDNISAWFWQIVETADRSRAKLQEMLHGMSRDGIIRFHNEFQEAAVQLTDERFTEFMQDDLSEDGVQDVAEWVVSQGKAFYSDIWDHPDHIPSNVEPGSTSTFSSVADNVYWERFHESIPDEVV